MIPETDVNQEMSNDDIRSGPQLSTIASTDLPVELREVQTQTTPSFAGSEETVSAKAHLTTGITPELRTRQTQTVIENIRNLSREEEDRLWRREEREWRREEREWRQEEREWRRRQDEQQAAWRQRMDEQETAWRQEDIEWRRRQDEQQAAWRKRMDEQEAAWRREDRVWKREHRTVQAPRIVSASKPRRLQPKTVSLQRLSGLTLGGVFLSVIIAGLSRITYLYFKNTPSSLEAETPIVYGFLNFMVLAFGIVLYLLQRKFTIYRSDELISVDENLSAIQQEGVDTTAE